MERAFLSALRCSINGGIAILAVLLMRAIFCRMPRRYLFLLWSVPALRLLIPITFPSPVSVYNVVPLPDSLYVGGEAEFERVGGEAAKTSALEFLPIIWIVGVIVTLAVFVIMYIRLARIIGKAEQKGEYYILENAGTPFVFGIIHPKIYLPPDIDPRDLPFILSHEKTHIHYRDNLVKAAALLIVSLHWFNPIVWLGYFLMLRDMEGACDDRTLLEIPDKKGYAEALLDISMRQNGINMGIAFGEKSVKSRIKATLNKKEAAPIAVAVSVMIIGIFSVCLLLDPAVTLKSGTSPIKNTEVTTVENAVLITHEMTKGKSVDLSVNKSFRPYGDGVYYYIFTVNQSDAENADYLVKNFRLKISADNRQEVSGFYSEGGDYSPLSLNYPDADSFLCISEGNYLHCELVFQGEPLSAGEVSIEYDLAGQGRYKFITARNVSIVS